jgi:hypothetical protein
MAISRVYIYLNVRDQQLHTTNRQVNIDAEMTLVHVNLSAEGIPRWSVPFDPIFVHYLVSVCASVWRRDELLRDRLLNGAVGMLR